jgi:hypothetical protein
VNLLHFAISHGIVGAAAFFAVAFAVMAMLSDQRALLAIGYLQIVFIPGAGVLGAVLGVVLGSIGRGASLERWLVGAGVLCLLAIVVNGGLALVLK